MSVRTHAITGYAILWTLLLLPARVVEEGLHALAVLPFAEAVSVRLTPGVGGAETAVQYRAHTPAWVKRLAHVLPELVATVSVVSVLAWWVLQGGATVWWPDSGFDWVLLWWIGVQYLAVAMPEQGGVGQ